MKRFLAAAAVAVLVFLTAALLVVFLGKFAQGAAWYGELKKWQTGLGAFAGLLAILVGALYNAVLVRQRDDRLRDEERRALAAALAAELLVIRNQCSGRIKALERGDQRAGSFLPFDVFLANVGNIGRLGADWAGSVAAAYAHFSILDKAVKSAGPEARATPEAAVHFVDACRRAENLRVALEGLAKGGDPDQVAKNFDPKACTEYC